MSLNCSFSVMHWDIIKCLASNERREMSLIMKYIVWLNSAWQWRYFTNKTGFLFIGTHCIYCLHVCFWGSRLLRSLAHISYMYLILFFSTVHLGGLAPPPPPDTRKLATLLLNWKWKPIMFFFSSFGSLFANAKLYKIGDWSFSSASISDL